MKLVIDISEENYNSIKNEMRNRDAMAEVGQAVEDGTPLPKGHGRLIDADIIFNKAIKHRENYMEAENSSYCRGKLHAYEVYVEEVENAPTIIDADKGEQE